jgi:HNH endonuclease
MAEVDHTQNLKRIVHPSRALAHGKPCPYCKRGMNLHSFNLRPTRDHVVPKSRGGRDTVICCNKCNGIKGDMLPHEWEAYMRANPGWWLLSKAERRRRQRPPRAPRQGTPPAPPVVVPPALIFPEMLPPKAEQ